jgi:methylthioribose-1-phosphate isomerase
LKVRGRPYRTLWPGADGASVEIIDQTRLPHEFVVARLGSLDEAAHAIRAMLVRGAPLIGATAAYGLWLGLRADPSDAALRDAGATLLATRPTAERPHPLQRRLARLRRLGHRARADLHGARRRIAHPCLGR